jgi:hypothetical protein
MIRNSEQKAGLNESNESIGLFKSEIFESVKPEVVYEFEWSEEEIAETEKAMNEGKLASLGSKIGLYLGDIDFESDYDELHAEFEKVLGTSKDSICMVDSETNEDDPMQAKIYNYLQAHFVSKEPVESPKFKNNKMGSFQMYDPKLNVIRLDDYGFVAFYYTTDSKF